MQERVFNTEQTKELFNEYYKTKDLDLRNEIIEHYLPIVDILVSKYLNRGIEYDDLKQVGSIALVLAVERFDPTKDYEFTSFATPTIIGEIKRHFRDKGWAMKVPRQLKEIALQLPKAQQQLSEKLQRQPRVDEIAEHLGHSEEKILEAMEGSRNFRALSLSQDFESSDGEDNEGGIERFTGPREKGFERFENADLIHRVVDSLGDREKLVFTRRMLEGGTQEDIAGELGVSQMTVSRIEEAIKQKFRSAWH
jgi:RNA polymerase sigma-B factor